LHEHGIAFAEFANAADCSVQRDGFITVEIRVDRDELNLYGDESITLHAAIDRVGEFGEGDAVLVKGSRVAGLERLVHAFG
ncbi:MAG: hypothetical protein ACKO61_05385, partial [Actinomycetota bacterium]